MPRSVQARWASVRPLQAAARHQVVARPRCLRAQGSGGTWRGALRGAAVRPAAARTGLVRNRRGTVLAEGSRVHVLPAAPSLRAEDDLSVRQQETGWQNTLGPRDGGDARGGIFKRRKGMPCDYRRVKWQHRPRPRSCSGRTLAGPGGLRAAGPPGSPPRGVTLSPGGGPHPAAGRGGGRGGATPALEPRVG